MDEVAPRFTLKFRGEIVDGQHIAVVRKRLQQAMKLDDNRTAMLFSGKTVVLKRDADQAMADRLSAAFQTAGAVLVVESAGGTTPANGARGASQLEALPVGGDLVSPDEVQTPEPVEVSTDHISMGNVFEVPEPDTGPAIEVPDVGHLSVADVGADIGEQREAAPAVTVDPSFSLADVGEDLIEASAPVTAAVEAPELDIAEPGARMAEEDDTPPPPAPDTSKIELAES